VVEVAAAIIAQLPPALRNSFDEGDQEAFDREVGRGKGLANWLRFTIRYRSALCRLPVERVGLSIA
jgi:hypothetical protein